MAVDFSEAAIRRQIASAFDLAIHVAHDEDERSGKKRRYVASIAEIRDLDRETEQVEIVELFWSHQGNLVPTGRLPSFGAELVQDGLFDFSAFCPDASHGGLIA